MANFVYVLVKGMDMTPGGVDESAVPKELRLGQQVELEQRVELLVRGRGQGWLGGLRGQPAVGVCVHSKVDVLPA